MGDGRDTNMGRAAVGLVLLTLAGGCGDVAGPSGTKGSGDVTTPFATAPRPSYTALQNAWDAPVTVSGSEVFTTDDDHILKDGEPFAVRGVVYVPGYPGFLPWDIETASVLPERLKASIDRDMADMAEMGANTVRLWGAPAYCYEALQRAGNLFFLQTLWIDVEAGDLHAPAFKDATRAYIRSVIDRIHGVYTDHAPPLIAYLVGNELSAATITETNGAHPGLTSYTGTFIQTGPGLNAAEVFVAEMADYVKQYESDTYGVTHLVSYANEIRTADLIDTPFLDFRSHNAYSYAVPIFRPGTALGSASGTRFQGWLEELKARHPATPLLVTETGLSVAPNAAHVGPPDYGYGGNTETEQMTGLLQNVEDAGSAAQPVAGVVVHEFLDAWWKFGLEDSYSQDPDDVEEWFGIRRLTGG
jgi:hypothetical protein